MRIILSISGSIVLSNSVGFLRPLQDTKLTARGYISPLKNALGLKIIRHESQYKSFMALN